jgi:hypothetical protein
MAGILALLRSVPVLPAVAAVALFSVGGAAFTAANTVPVSSAGSGATAVSGYTISNIDYNLNGTTFANIDTVTFTATAANGDASNTNLTIKVKFNTAAGYYDCTRTGGVAPAHNISCDTDGTPGPQLTVANTNTFDAIIVQQ